MKRKVALLMATLMAGSSLSGSYVSAASIEGISEENEIVSPEEEADTAYEYEQTETESLEEDAILQDEELVQEESSEFALEEDLLSEEEADENEEQIIEEEPVQLLMEDGEAAADEQEEGEEENGEQNYEFDYRNLSDDPALLPGEDYNIPASFQIGVKSEDEEDWKWREVNITEVKVTSGRENLVYEGSETSDIVPLSEEENQYHMEAAKNIGVGFAEIRITWASDDAENGKISGVYDGIYVRIAGARYVAGYECENENGDGRLLPGQEMDITTSLIREWYDTETEEQRSTDISDYTIQFIYDENGKPYWDTELIDVEINSENSQSLHVKAKDRSGTTQIPIDYLTNGNGVQQEWIRITVSNGFFVVEPRYLTEEDGERRNPQVGDVLDLSDVGIQTCYYASDSEEKTVEENVRYRVEYDEKAWEVMNPDQIRDGYGLPELLRKGNWGNDITVIAESTKNGEELDSRCYHFDERQYEFGFKEDNLTLFYGERSAPLTIAADTSRLDEEGLSDYRITYVVEQYRNDQIEETTCATYTTSDDDWSCTLKPADGFSEEEDVWLHVRAVVRKNKIEITSADMDIPVAATEVNTDRLPQDTVLLPGWGYTIDSEYWIWRRDSAYPEGEDVKVKITDVRIVEDNDEILSENENGEKIEKDEGGNYQLGIVRDDIQMRSGEAKIAFDYIEADGLSDEANAGKYVSGTGEFTITVEAQKYSTGFEYENGKTQLLPGETMTVNTSLYLDWYDIDEDSHNGQEVEDYRIALLYNEDGTPAWDTDLIEAEVDAENGKRVHVTAKDTEDERETDIPIRYLIGEDEVGMEWIHVAVCRQFCIIEPGYLEGEDGERLNPYIGEILNLTDAGIQTWYCSAENEEKEKVEDVRYRVEYDENVWKKAGGGVDEEGYGLPVLKRIRNWGTDVTVIAEKTENGEEIARQSYWFDEYDYFPEYEYSMNGESLDYGHFYTNEVPLQVTLSVEPGLPEGAVVEWDTVIYDENGTESQPDWVTLTEDEQDPCKVQVTLSEDAEKEQHINDGFDLRAVVKIGDYELARINEWINLQDVQFDFEIPYLIYLTGSESDPMEFRDTDRYELYQQSGNYPNGKTEYVKVVNVTEMCEEGQKLLSIQNTEEGILVTPKDDEQVGDTAVTLELQYEDSTDAGSVEIPVYIQDSITELDEVQFDSDGSGTQLLPGQTLGLTTVVKNFWREGKELKNKDLKEGEDYTVEFCDYNTDIVEYQKDGRFHAKGRGNTGITLRIWDMDGNEISSYSFEVQVTGSYFKAEQGETEGLMVAAGGPEIEIPYRLRRYSISNPEGQDVNPNNVILESMGENPVLHISYRDGKIMAALDKDTELEAGEKRETQFELTFLDEEGNALTGADFTLILHRHDMQTIVDKKETCGTAGSQHEECTVCDAKGAETEIPATGEHRFGGYTVTQEPTCAKEGVQTRTCEVCDKTETAPVAKTAHNMQLVVDTPATCGSEGSQHKECTVCHTREAATAIPATGNHSFGEYVTTQVATIFAKGTETRTCSICGKTESRETAQLSGTIRLTVNKLPLQVGKSVALSKIVTDLADGDYIASCTTSNKKVATVTNKGKVTGKAAGTAKITISLASGTTATVTINVQKKAVTTTGIRNLSKIMELSVKEKSTLTPVISPITTTDKLTYTFSDKKIVTVSGKGVITAKKAGKAKVTVKSGKKKFVITVKVTAPAPTGMKNIPAAKTLAKGKTFALKPTLVPSGAQAKISYTTSNKKVATVDAKGKVTAKGKGKAVITITAGKVKKTCTVTVK